MMVNHNKIAGEHAQVAIQEDAMAVVEEMPWKKKIYSLPIPKSKE